MVTRKNIGGYRLVSLGFLDLALISVATACEGLALALASKSKKRVVLTDIVVSGEPKNDVGVEVEKISGGYAIKNVYGYDLEIVTSGSTLKATPSADHITASEIDSETATAGQAILANGSGGASFGNIEVGASQIDSGSATSGQVLTADGEGGVAFANPAGGGTQLYLHNIEGIGVGNPSSLQMISKSPEPITGDSNPSVLSDTSNIILLRTADNLTVFAVSFSGPGGPNAKIVNGSYPIVTYFYNRGNDDPIGSGENSVTAVSITDTVTAL